MSTMDKRHNSLTSNQDGMVSMIIAVLIMLMLSLIVLAMSQNASREQRQALDRQLSDQAFYDAESGINDTINYLFTHPDADRQKPDCDPSFLNTAPVDAAHPPTSYIDANGINRYTCVLYDKQPKELYLDDVGMSDSKIIPIETVDDAGMATPLNTLTISWDNAGISDNVVNDVAGCNFTAGSPPLPVKLPDHCNVGGVRIDIINPLTLRPPSPPTPLQPDSRDQLIRQVTNAFLLPNKANAAGTLNFATIRYPDNQGVIGQANCSNSTPPAPLRQCQMVISGVPLSNSVLHIRSLYGPADITINATSLAGQPLHFVNAQIVVDVTGKSSDVLRRVQVRVPAKPQYRQAEFGIQSKDAICKLLSVVPGSVTADPTSCPVN